MVKLLFHKTLYINNNARARALRARLLLSIVSYLNHFESVVIVVFDEVVRYVSQKVIISGNRVEVWKYENPIRADVINRVHGLPDVVDSDSDHSKLYSNLRRAQFTIRQLVWCNLTEYTKFVTLTYAATVLDMKVVNKDMQNFFRKLKRKMNFDPAYIWVPEPQKGRGLREGNSGCLHVHIVLFNCEKIPLYVLNSCWPHGRTEIRILNGCRLSDDEKIRSAAAYLSKYISKDNIVQFGKHSFRCSLNLKRPVETGIYCLRSISDNGIVKYIYDDRSFDLSKFKPSFSKSFLLNYEINGEPVQNGCLYMQGDLNDT